MSPGCAVCLLCDPEPLTRLPSLGLRLCRASDPSAAASEVSPGSRVVPTGRRQSLARPLPGDGRAPRPSADRSPRPRGQGGGPADTLTRPAQDVCPGAPRLCGGARRRPVTGRPWPRASNSWSLPRPFSPGGERRGGRGRGGGQRAQVTRALGTERDQIPPARGWGCVVRAQLSR